MSALAPTSTPRVDSSGSSTLGRVASHFPRTTFCLVPPENRDFGQIRFAVALFDEAQKMKTPAARVTDATKAMNCEFRVALTGTPVKNGLADLWCIADGVQPGALDDLKALSSASSTSKAWTSISSND